MARLLAGQVVFREGALGRADGALLLLPGILPFACDASPSLVELLTSRRHGRTEELFDRFQPLDDGIELRRDLLKYAQERMVAACGHAMSLASGLGRSLRRASRIDASIAGSPPVDRRWHDRRQTRSRRPLGHRFAELLAWFTAGGKTLAILDPSLDTSTPSGRLIANIFASVAEWETDTIAARSSEALQAKRAAGPINPSRPAVADNGELAGRILALRAGGTNLARIAETLNAGKVPTVRGGATWRASSVQS
jgi:hypothetical protein